MIKQLTTGMIVFSLTMHIGMMHASELRRRAVRSGACRMVEGARKTHEAYRRRLAQTMELQLREGHKHDEESDEQFERRLKKKVMEKVRARDGYVYRTINGNRGGYRPSEAGFFEERTLEVAIRLRSSQAKPEVKEAARLFLHDKAAVAKKACCYMPFALPTAIIGGYMVMDELIPLGGPPPTSEEATWCVSGCWVCMVGSIFSCCALRNICQGQALRHIAESDEPPNCCVKCLALPGFPFQGVYR